jgi:hypothetical protein
MGPAIPTSTAVGALRLRRCDPGDDLHQRPVKNLRRQRTGERAFNVLDEHGAGTAFNCSGLRKIPAISTGEPACTVILGARNRAQSRPLASALRLAVAAILTLSSVAASAPDSAVGGHVGSHWEPNVTVGAQQRFGGYLLRCASLPNDNVFPGSDVRPAGAAQPEPPATTPEPAGPVRPVRG